MLETEPVTKVAHAMGEVVEAVLAEHVCVGLLEDVDACDVVGEQGSPVARRHEHHHASTSRIMATANVAQRCEVVEHGADGLSTHPLHRCKIAGPGTVRADVDEHQVLTSGDLTVPGRSQRVAERSHCRVCQYRHRHDRRTGDECSHLIVTVRLAEAAAESGEDVHRAGEPTGPEHGGVVGGSGGDGCGKCYERQVPFRYVCTESDWASVAAAGASR